MGDGGRGYMTLLRSTEVAPEKLLTAKIRGCELSLENTKIMGRHQGHL